MTSTSFACATLLCVTLLAASGCDDTHGASPDGGTPDAGSPDPGRPLSCTPNAYAGDPSADGTLTVTSGAALCARIAHEIVYGDLSEREPAIRASLAAALDAPSVATLAPGTYPLPLVDSTVDLTLPMCVQDGSLAGVATGTADGATVQSQDVGGFGAARGHRVDATVPLGSESLVVSVLLDYDTGEATLGTLPATDHRAATIARGEQLYVPCALAPTVCHELSFPGLATLRLEEYVWRDSPGLGFAATVRAAGTVMGTAFDVRRAEQLPTAYGHHAFDRYTFVRFEAPVGGACGLRVDLDVSELWQAALADCDGVPIASAVVGTAESVACP